jgi:hypothetical protein
MIFMMCVSAPLTFSYQWENYHEAAFKNVLINKTCHKLSLACLYENIANLPTIMKFRTWWSNTSEFVALSNALKHIRSIRKKIVRVVIKGTSDLDIMEQDWTGFCYK